MNKTIKIIDLLNKIANGEIPKEIKYNNYFLNWDDVDKDYYCEYYGNLFTYLFSNDQTTVVLDYEIEIIEDNDKLEKIEKEELFTIDESMTKSSLVAWQKANNGIFKKQIDFLIDHINKIEEKLDE